MRAIAAYIERGFAQAILVVVVSAVLSLFLPLLSLLSSAVVGLVTLSQGARNGIVVIAVSAVITTVLAYLGRGMDANFAIAVAITLLFAVWLPVWLLAWVLRVTLSLPAAIYVAASIALLGVIAMYIAVDDVAAWWTTVLTALFEPALQENGALVTSTQMDEAIRVLAASMTGLMGAGVVIGFMCSLFIARWWQAMLYNEGGFQREFHNLRLHRALVIPVVIALVVSNLASGVLAGIANDLFVITMAIYMLHGLGLLHGVVAIKKAHKGWLTGVYMAAVFIPPQVMFVLAAAGVSDSWVNFRANMRAAQLPPPSDPNKE
ncbi:MAG: hypothetical protein GXP10_03265 [Gammaproteobacteria bacterium]|nr:hypothetical protein [Gammaproteobacteria bacterium]